MDNELFWVIPALIFIVIAILVLNDRGKHKRAVPARRDGRKPNRQDMTRSEIFENAN